MLLENKKSFIEFMLEAKVLRFGDFVTKSGRNTPYFVNTGNYKTGAQISGLGAFYADAIAEITKGEFEAMFGPAYKGIPIAASAAGALYRNHQMDKPYFFNRKEEKDHGEGGSIVGYKPQDGDRVILVEDVITAGTAVRETMPVLQSCAKVSVPHMFISVDRCEVGQVPGKTAIMQVREDYDMQVHALVTVQDIYAYLQDRGDDKDMLQRMQQYMETYCVLEK